MEKPHRIVTEEPDIPFEYQVLFENGRVIVIDKPHFLSTTPRGMWYRNTALIRLRKQFNNDEIIPAHRLDRPTAGIVLFVKHVDDRGRYQMRFQLHEVIKTYECLAPLPPDPTIFPLTRRSHITKDRSVLQAYEEAGKPVNAETLIEFVGPVDDPRLSQSSEASGKVSTDFAAAAEAPQVGLYRLHPKTGKTHQLRVHMNALGLPILNDDLYPTVQQPDYTDFSRPLQLVAARLQMTDPFSGADWDFHSHYALEPLSELS